MSVPILGRITHSDKCQIIKMGDCVSWLGDSCNLTYDGYGFWFHLQTVIAYKNVNKL